ncbi:hypothetical protein MMC10_007014 [Thelotrema lepadinum]|nr:hypothetical protein [Thelotrema lepadinum]
MKAVPALAAWGLLALALAAPNNHPQPKTCKNPSAQTANFDDLTGLPALQVNPIPVPYNGLDFQGFVFLEVIKTGILPGAIPHSGMNYAVSNALTTTTGGSAEWTVNYSDSKVKSFSPSSFYYGCSIDLQNGAAALPTHCNVAITGFARGG